MYVPHPTTSWYHLSCVPRRMLKAKVSNVEGLENTSVIERAVIRAVSIPKCLPTISGTISLGQFASAMTSKYGRFRSFSFGLDTKYTPTWNWRCFLATMIVCNTKEEDMLRCTNVLYKHYPDAQSMHKVGIEESQRQVLQVLKDHKIRHASRKARDVSEANRTIVEKFGGMIPSSRRELQAMRGVGRHVSSVTMAWVHEKAEFGIDVHVNRILKRWEFFHPSATDTEIENEVKKNIPPKLVGHFSRAFVDHGQTVCGYVPDCEACYLRHACPSADKSLDW